MPKKLKAVVAGCSWGGNHMRAFVESEHAELVGAWSRSDKPHVTAMYQIPLYTNFDQMLDEIKPDIVSIATPESSHCELTVKALNAGAHVYCEKVLAASLEEALQMDAAATKAEKQLNVGYNYRYSPSCIFLTEKLKSGAIGQPLFAMLRAFSCCIHHMTDYATSLLGSPERVAAVINDKIPKGKSEPLKPVIFPTFVYTAMTAKSYMVQYHGGATLLAAATDFSSADSSGTSLIIEGTEGRLELNDLCGEVTLYKAEAPFKGDRLKTVYSPSQILDRIGLAENCISSVKSFTAAMFNGEDAPIPASAGINMIMLEESIMKAAKTGQWEIIK
jgi:predicted dehydrogenase